MRTSKLCVTVTGRTMAELRRHRDEVVNADLVELRLDTVADPSVAGALDGRKLPVIVTCRPSWEGGQFKGSEEERLGLLQEAQRLGAEYVDVEFKAESRAMLATQNGRGVIVSMHDFQGVPRDLQARVDAMRATGAEVIKVAAMTSCLSDCLAMLHVATPSSSPTVVVAMGDAGIVSRVLPERFNSCWTYAGDGVAPGQITAETLTDVFRFRRLHAVPSVYGVVGRPVMHSLSPAMHNAAFDASGIDAVYLPLAASDFDDFERFADAMGIVGASVTAPFKVTAFERAREHDALSARVEAANTLRRHPAGEWEACNTDVAGFVAPLKRRGISLQNARVTILGAGGAARAAAVALHAEGSELRVAARSREQAEHLAARFGGGVGEWPPARDSWDVLVNSTSVGTTPDIDTTPIPGAAFTGQLVYDLVYNPPDTRLLRDAAAAGCRTIGGLEMLVAQAERQFAWWTGTPPARGVMQEAALAALRTFSPSGTFR